MVQRRQVIMRQCCSVIVRQVVYGTHWTFCSETMVQRRQVIMRQCCSVIVRQVV